MKHKAEMQVIQIARLESGRMIELAEARFSNGGLTNEEIVEAIFGVLLFPAVKIALGRGMSEDWIEAVASRTIAAACSERERLKMEGAIK